MLVIVSKEFVGYLLAAIGPIALGKIYDVCHSWTMPLVLLQGGDTVVFKDDCVIIEPTQKDLENQGFVAGSICF